VGYLLGAEQTIVVPGADQAEQDGPPAGAALAADLQERLREWADKELPLRIQQAERSAVCCGDGIYTLAWGPAKDSPAAPTSEQIKASAQARLDASLLEGRKVQLAIVETGQTPSDELCQALWDGKTTAEQHALLYALWMHGCVDAPGRRRARAQHRAGPAWLRQVCQAGQQPGRRRHRGDRVRGST
jgi:hypothetical protein